MSNYYVDYENDDDWRDLYGEAGFQKTPKAKKMKKEEKHKKDKHSRHASQEDIWDSGADYADNSKGKKTEREEYVTLADVSKPKSNFRDSAQNSSPERKFVLGPNTQTIRNYQIDFDRVYSISKIEGEYNGKHNFGVKFDFKGTKGLFRTIWFYSERDRDALYDDKYAFWTSLETCPLNRKKEGIKNGRY